jgi:uridine phosphorylase
MGMTATYDAFYPRMAPALVKRSQPDLEHLKAVGILALDMETSLLYILGCRLGIAATSLCLVTNEADPFTVMDSQQRAKDEAILIQTALDGLVAWDSRRE